MNGTNTTADQHPDEDTLRKFSAGTLTDEISFVAIENHVAECQICARHLTQMKPGAVESVVAAWAANVDLPTVDGIPRYEIIEEIGRGGSGVVYKARQAGLERFLALKILISGSRASPAELVRFRREARALARLDHSQIVKVHDFGEQQGAPFLALELVDGPSLARRLEKGPVEPHTVASWVRDLALAMDYAHHRSIFHRDLKPQNVLLATSATVSADNNAPGLNTLSSEDSNYVPKIADFGLARFEDDSLFHTCTGETLGTPAYLAPEMIGTKHGDEVVATVDVYGLGTILYECLTGRPPFVGSSHLEILSAVANREPPAIRVLRHSVPRDLEVICQRCLAKRPSQRFSTAAALADDLDRFLKGEPITSRPVTRLERTIRWCRRNPWKAVATSLAILAALAIPAAGIYHNAQLRHEKSIAQARYESTRATLWEMLNLLNTEQAQAVPQLAELSEKQTAKALALFRELSEVDPSDSSELDVASAEILAGTLAITLGKITAGEPLLQRAVEICSRIKEESAVSEQALGQLADALNKLGVGLGRVDDGSRSISYLNQALEIHRQLENRSPGNPKWRSGVAWSLMNLGSERQIRGEIDQAIPLFEESISICESLAANSPATPDSDSHLQAAAGSRINLATIYLGLGKVDKAEEYFRSGFGELEKLIVRIPNNKSVVEDLSVGLLNYSNLLSDLGRKDDAVAACTRARELLQAALKLEPNHASLRQNLFLVTANRAGLNASRNEFLAASDDWREATSLAPEPSMKIYCQQMRIRCLASHGDTLTAILEIAAIDESKIQPDEQFLQVTCWALLTDAWLRKKDAGTDATAAAEASAAADKAWTILLKLQSEGHLDADRKEHLRTSGECNGLKNFRTDEEWQSLIR